MQRSMDLFAAAYDNFGLRISTEKTVVMHQPPPNTTYNKTHINVNGAQLTSADTFTYLGSNPSRSTTVDDEIAHLLAKANQASGACRTSSGIDMVSNTAPNSRCTKFSYCRSCCIERRLGQSTKNRRGSSTNSTSATPKDTKAEMTRQDSGH
ncbi:unnamed protein product [Schistocephalus solidus]|uniref:Reverse transcriptase domain-containing protein n=1 Tax=Schistocephalus solidus TaxID=70667 RepID=A0A183T3H9_SCHSO|nr:unnamed protein product [Schistocephalus solidus]